MGLNFHRSQHQGHVGVVGWWGQALGFAPAAPASLWGGSDPPPPLTSAPRVGTRHRVGCPSLLQDVRSTMSRYVPSLASSPWWGVVSWRGPKGTPGQWGIIPLPSH